MSVLPDDQVAVEGDFAGFAAGAGEVVEAGDAVVDDVPEGPLDAGQADVQGVAVGVEQVVDALADLLRIVAAGEAGVDATDFFLVFLQLFEASPFRMPQIEEVQRFGQVVHLYLPVVEVCQENVACC